MMMSKKRTSIVHINPKVAIDIRDPHAPLIGYHPQQSLADIPDVIILVQQPDVISYCGCRRIPVDDPEVSRWSRRHVQYEAGGLGGDGTSAPW